MTTQWYRENGFELSANFSQPMIDKAESEVWDAYIVPVIPTADKSDTTLQEFIAPLAYCYLCLYNNKVTRKGTKEKQDDHSTSVTNKSLLIERTSANKAFYKMTKRDDAVESFEVHDICHIWQLSPILGIN